MITVTAYGGTFTCTTALKGTDYIHLLDSNNKLIVAFDGVTDFTGFSISGGNWTAPTSVDECYLVTMGDDGVLRKGGHKCSDITNHNHDGRYYTETEVNTILQDYYTETEVNTLLSGMTKIATNVSVSSWSSDSTYTGYGYRASIAITGVTTDYVPSVNFGFTEASSGKYAPVAQTYNGGVYIYSKQNTSITIPSIVCQKGV